MAKLQVLHHPNDILRQATITVEKFDDTLQKLIDDMFETMDAEDGIGLAAPQVGILDQLLVVGYKNIRQAFINPEIIATSKDESVMEEGCLSLPGVHLPVSRPNRITVRAQTATGESYEKAYKGMVARILQHEIDHLHGVLILDKAITA